MLTPLLHALGRAIIAFLIFFITCSIPMLIGSKTGKQLGRRMPLLLALLAGTAVFLLNIP